MTVPVAHDADTDTDLDPAAGDGRFSTPVVVLLQAVAILAVLAGAGAICGVLWFHFWDAPSGVVQQGKWFTDETGLRADFAATGLYVVIALLAGLLAGALVALVFDRWELVSLVCVVGGAALAGWVMWKVGVHRSPPDPDTLAAKAADGTTLPGHLDLSRRTPFVSFPLGGVLGYTIVLLAVPKRGARRRTTAPETPAGPAGGPTQQSAQTYGQDFGPVPDQPVPRPTFPDVGAG